MNARLSALTTRWSEQQAQSKQVFGDSHKKYSDLVYTREQEAL